MKRARRLTLSRCNGDRRRRIARMLRAAFPYGDGSSFYRAPPEMRDARRLAEAGICAVVATKTWWGVGHAKEMSLYRTAAAARERYPRTTFPVGRSWGGEKRPKKGSDRRRAKRMMREPLALIPRRK